MFTLYLIEINDFFINILFKIVVHSTHKTSAVFTTMMATMNNIQTTIFLNNGF
jgi:hypothetical protein